MIGYLRATTIKRSAGSSIVAAAAYQSASELTNEYTGLTHSYESKGGVIASEVLLPPGTPTEYKSSERLWSSLECAEKSPKARLGLNIVAAIPTEIPEQERIRLAQQFCQHFLDLGVCVQYSYHNPIARDDRDIPINLKGLPAASPEEYQYLNPHLHILMPYRQLDENGRWKPRTVGQYIMQNQNTGEIRPMTAEEIKTVDATWEKQYLYRTSEGEKWMTKSAAEQIKDAERVHRFPRSTRHGIAAPEVEYLGSPQLLHDMRIWWQDDVNYYLEQAQIEERIDMRSYRDQATGKIPQIHMGPSAAHIVKQKNRLAAEGQGTAQQVRSILSDINKEIRRHNHMVDVFRAEEEKARTIDDQQRQVAQLMETFRREWISARCHDIELTKQILELEEKTEVLRERLDAYDSQSATIRTNISRLQAEIQDLKAERDNTIRPRDRKRIETEIESKKCTATRGETMLQQLLSTYGYDSDKDLQRDRRTLHDAEQQLEIRNQLLSAAKKQAADTKKKYMRMKEKVERMPVKYRRVITEYQRVERKNGYDRSTADLLGITWSTVIQVEQMVEREIEEEQWQEKML